MKWKLKNLAALAMSAAMVLSMAACGSDSGSTSTAASAAGIYLAGLPVNAVHAFATFLTVFFLGKPIEEKLDRIKVKYGMMGGDEDEI